MQSYLQKEDWERFYMGEDGRFTMYVDAVAGTYATSSVAARHQLGDMTIAQAFGKLNGR